MISQSLSKSDERNGVAVDGQPAIHSQQSFYYQTYNINFSFNPPFLPRYFRADGAAAADRIPNPLTSTDALFHVTLLASSPSTIIPIHSHIT